MSPDWYFSLARLEQDACEFARSSPEGNPGKAGELLHSETTFTN